MEHVVGKHLLYCRDSSFFYNQLNDTYWIYREPGEWSMNSPYISAVADTIKMYNTMILFKMYNAMIIFIYIQNIYLKCVLFPILTKYVSRNCEALHFTEWWELK